MEFLRRFAGFFIRQENMDGSGTDNEDRLSSLPDSMLCEILLKLSTKDVVRTSVLSNRWRNLWRSVPGLDLSCDDLREYNTFVSFVDRFLGFNSELCIENLKVKYQLGSAHVTRWINDVVKRRVKHLSVIAYHWSINGAHIPSTVYTCESLVTLELREATLLSPKFVFLPCLKVISLIRVKFANNLAFEMLISGSPLLESLSLVTISFENINCFRVCSESLLRLTHFENYSIGEDLVIAIDAPRLRYLKLSDMIQHVSSFIVKDLGSLVKVDMDIVFKLGYGRRFRSQ
ncbi:unnamed protein product [Microthlaspi erraticum]|uniref:F-box domain-containing protein n=1 Tax=Microthlaspi erraticum TaxID=1685480 RepID=A0A6D2JAH7_9BRAS|nr:unnamed protein product [Microthlaspi erraticum]